jgi:hypothetical protein
MVPRGIRKTTTNRPEWIVDMDEKWGSYFHYQIIALWIVNVLHFLSHLGD